MSLQDQVPSPQLGKTILRSGIPIVVGFTAMLFAKAGLGKMAPDMQVTITSFVMVGYGSFAHWLEHIWPQAGWLLGSPGKAHYEPKPMKVFLTSEDPDKDQVAD